MEDINEIKRLYSESIQLSIDAADLLAEDIIAATDTMLQSLLSGHKVLVCGQGACGILARHFVSLLMDRYEIERPALPALCLNADASLQDMLTIHQQQTDRFARSVKAWANAGDTLLTMTLSGNTPDVMHAIDVARDKQVRIVVMTGGDNDARLSHLLQEEDIELHVESKSLPRAHEQFLFMIHSFCTLIEHRLFQR